MAVTIQQIKAPVGKELVIFEKKFKAWMKSPVPLLNKITYYLVKRKGKQLRPLLVFLSARIFSEITESTYRAANLIELLHTATLVHDDVVDDSHYRRGFFSINALWKNKIAVLVGDFLLSRGLIQSLENEDYNLLKIVSEAVKKMSEGELLQIEKTRKPQLDESVYFDIISMKTASLFASCCACGSASVNASADVVKKMKEIGQLAGMAFQIKDDLFDFQKNNESGKPTGTDIRGKKLTLPLIYTINHASAGDRKMILKAISNKKNQNGSVEMVIDFVNEHGGMDYAIQRMNEYKSKALELLSTFEQSIYTEAFGNLLDYVVERKK